MAADDRMTDTVAAERELYLREQSSLTFSQPPMGDMSFFVTGNKLVFKIKADGKLERGEGLSDDEASLALFDILSKSMYSWMSALRERAEKAEAELAALKEAGSIT